MHRNAFDARTARRELRADLIAVDAQYAVFDTGLCAESRAPDDRFMQHEAHAGQFTAIARTL